MQKIKLYIVLCLFLIARFGKAQSPPYIGTTVNDPTWQKINALSDDFTSLDCAGGGVYSCNISGFPSPTWSFINPSSSWHGAGTHTDGVTCLALNGSDLWAGTSTAQEGSGGIFKSSSGGAWTRYANNTTPATPIQANFVNAIAVNGSNIYAGMQGGINYSSNNGSSWSTSGGGMAPVYPLTNVTTNDDVVALAINTSNGNVFAGLYGTYGGVSLYNGSSWSAVNSGLTNRYVTSLLYISGTSLVAGTDGGGVFYTSNSGTSWTAVNGTGLGNLQINALILDGSTLIVATNGGVFYSTNYSSGTPTWSSANASGLTNLSVTSLARISSGSIVAGTNGSGVFYSANYSSGSPSWVSVNGTGFTSSLSVSSLLYDGSSTLYVGICPKWRVLDLSVRDCCGSNTPSLVSCTSGILDLQDDASFNWATIETYGAKYGYGYYEMYAQTPYASDVLTSLPNWDKFHPSFWAYYNVGDGCCTEYNHQEIDIFEPGSSDYFNGNVSGMGYHHELDDGSSLPGGGTDQTYRTLFTNYTYSGFLYNAYHKYAVEYEPDRMIWYFDDIPILSGRNQADFALEGFFQVQMSSSLDANDGDSHHPGTYGYAGGDVLPAHYKIDYFNYYKLNFNCGQSITCTNNTTGTVNTTQLSGANAYVPAVYSDITLAPTGALTIGSGDNFFYRAVNTITIEPATGGSFSVPLGQTLTLLPTPCDH